MVPHPKSIFPNVTVSKRQSQPRHPIRSTRRAFVPRQVRRPPRSPQCGARATNSSILAMEQRAGPGENSSTIVRPGGKVDALREGNLDRVSHRVPCQISQCICRSGICRKSARQSRFEVFKGLQKLFERRAAESDVRPYRKLCQQASRVFLGGVEVGDQVVVRSQTRNPALDFARDNMFPQLREEACVNREVGRNTSACAHHHQLTF